MMFEGQPVGVNITVPVGLRAPEYAPLGRVATFEKVEVRGLYSPTLAVCGQKTTFPVGKRTP